MQIGNSYKSSHDIERNIILVPQTGCVQTSYSCIALGTTAIQQFCLLPVLIYCRGQSEKPHHPLIHYMTHCELLDSTSSSREWYFMALPAREYCTYLFSRCLQRGPMMPDPKCFLFYRSYSDKYFNLATGMFY